MNEPNKSEISRREVFSLLGLGIVLGFAAPTAMLMASGAEAQTPGMERRQDRREGRHDRRQDRREGRHDRREDRRGGRGHKNDRRHKNKEVVFNLHDHEPPRTLVLAFCSGPAQEVVKC